MEELRIREAEGMFLAAQYWEPLSGSSAPLKSNLSSSSDDIVTDNRAPVMIRDVRVSVRSLFIATKIKRACSHFESYFVLAGTYILVRLPANKLYQLV